MSVLYANTINETQKILVQRKTKGFLIFTFMIPILIAGALHYIQNRLGMNILSESDFSYLLLDWFTSIILPLFIFMVATDLFVGEVSARTLKLTLVRPISRFKVYVSKILAMGISIIIQLGIMWFTSLAVGSLVFHGWSMHDFFQVWLGYALDFIPMFTLGVFAVLIGQFLTSTSGAFALCTVLFVIAKILGIFFPSLSAFLFTSYTDWHSLWIDSSASGSHLISVTLVILSSLILFFSIGYYQFDTKEV
ncbi:ABC transporter permease [Polycladomyces subterraneus]|uniref:ABC transporter permease n=1 Tax=Polycladomyces subterraneus TaxID=1016997 RepID=A0ABT8IQN7_9BACL|nr:ABC transporter permease subunit [Polycladomyces subterraneus]MDN4595116.1 ABC transporter permease [Polycladomyces subterraneus]